MLLQLARGPSAAAPRGGAAAGRTAAARRGACTQAACSGLLRNPPAAARLPPAPAACALTRRSNSPRQSASSMGLSQSTMRPLSTMPSTRTSTWYSLRSLAACGRRRAGWARAHARMAGLRAGSSDQSSCEPRAWRRAGRHAGSASLPEGQFLLQRPRQALPRPRPPPARPHPGPHNGPARSPPRPPTWSRSWLRKVPPMRPGPTKPTPRGSASR